MLRSNTDVRAARSWGKKPYSRLLVVVNVNAQRVHVHARAGKYGARVMPRERARPGCEGCAQCMYDEMRTLFCLVTLRYYAVVLRLTRFAAAWHFARATLAVAFAVLCTITRLYSRVFLPSRLQRPGKSSIRVIIIDFRNDVSFIRYNDIIISPFSIFNRISWLIMRKPNEISYNIQHSTCRDKWIFVEFVRLWQAYMAYYVKVAAFYTYIWARQHIGCRLLIVMRH